MSWSSRRLKIFPDCSPICYEAHYKCVLCQFAICTGEDIPSWRALNSEQIRRNVETFHKELNGLDHALKLVKRERWS